ncbi:MAG: hypothetical protein IKW24_03485 [Clostridia bacterium]|nr:hypothetical protein [Clostridia bacterium]
MKKALSVILTLVMLIGIALPVMAEQSPIISENPTKIKAFDPKLDSSKSPHQVQPGEIYGAHLSLGAPFNGLAYCLPTWSTTDSDATLVLYAWDETYEKTLSAAPIAEQRFENLRDCQTYTLSFDEQPAGEYLFCIKDVEGTVGTWVYPATVSQGFIMQDGAEKNGDLEITVSFTKTPEIPFYKATSAQQAYTGHEVPDEYTFAEDSLIYTHEVMPDTWVFTDGLGRVSLTNAEVGDLKEDKTLAIFYWTWHVDLSFNQPFNNTAFTTEHPEAINDYFHEGWPTSGAAYFWNEPLFGYYRTDDPWVLRKHAEMLTNAGIDVIFTDNTNGNYTWKSSYVPLYETWSAMQQNGMDTPKVSFMLPFGPTDGSLEQLHSLYLDIYRTDKYHSLWYYLDGKPMLMAHSSNLSAKSGLDTEIKNFFTFRAGQPGYTVKNTQKLTWGWLSTYPQATYYVTTKDKKQGNWEQIAVGVAINHSYVTDSMVAMNHPDAMGRSYTSAGYRTEADAKLWGYQLAEQFAYAIEQDPKVIFVTGWNEWTAGRNENWSNTPNGFPDQFDDEHSRDIEPSKGDLKDHYYYQLVNASRQFQGARPIPTPSAAQSIDLSAGAEQWSTAAPYYAAYIGNTGDRDHKGYGSTYYTEFSGRNDIIGARVARDDEFVYFFVECNEDITPYTDPLWMVLYLDTDQSSQGWETFEYVLNKTSPTATEAVLERFTGNGYETEVVGKVSYTVDGKYMQVAVPKSMLGLSGYDFTINFSWTDNVHDASDKGTQTADGAWVYSTFSGDILDFYTSGDVAPGMRFKYSYQSTAANAGIEQDTTEDTTAESGEQSTDNEGGEESTTEAPEQNGCKSVAMWIGFVLIPAALCIKRKRD